MGDFVGIVVLVNVKNDVLCQEHADLYDIRQAEAMPR